jgi:FtsP/CotA-like multicopper oxidase with cupredoxin domain
MSKKGLSMNYILYGFILLLSTIPTAFAANRVIDLTVAPQTVNYTGETRQAIAVNQQIPGPILHFKQGDQVTINVYNHLQQGTTIHWHGIMVPWQMDGVEGVSQQAIPPNGVFHYQFTLYQAGTYWYHAHAGLQEQEGLYGAFIIDPPNPSPYTYNEDKVIVLSDWSNTPAQQIYNHLKQGTGKEGAAKSEMQMPMGTEDTSDVAYDAYLLNGQPSQHPWSSLVKVGDTVRLRFIGAAASTIYRVSVSDSNLQIVHVQGNDVKPYSVADFSIAPGETYDVLIKIKKNTPYVIYAQPLGQPGMAVGVLRTNPQQKMDHQLIMSSTEKMAQRSAAADKNLSMSAAMSMSAKPSRIGDTLVPPNASQPNLTSGTKYQALTAAVKTNDPDKPIYRVIPMELSGNMDGYQWLINGLPEQKAKPILIQPGKRYRLIFTNDSMMPHPMHIHGHWFILRNGHGSYDPLLHTIDVPPGAIVVADVDADASGQWYFHCHNLYHMEAGMARIFRYTTLMGVVNGTETPEKVILPGSYVNRPIVRVDEVLPINPALFNQPRAAQWGDTPARK